MNRRESHDPLRCRLLGYGVLFVYALVWGLSLIYIKEIL